MMRGLHKASPKLEELTNSGTTSWKKQRPETRYDLRDTRKNKLCQWFSLRGTHCLSDLVKENSVELPFPFSELTPSDPTLTPPPPPSRSCWRGCSRKTLWCGSWNQYLILGGQLVSSYQNLKHKYSLIRELYIWETYLLKYADKYW